MAGEKIKRILDKLRADGRAVVDEEKAQNRLVATLKAFRVISPEVEDTSRRQRELKKRDPEKSTIIGRMIAGEAMVLRDWMPKPRGRPGAGKDDLVRMDALLAADEGMSLTTAARQVLADRGEKGELKGKADALVKRWKARQNRG